MRRISSKATFCYKRIFPIIWFAVIGTFFLASLGTFGSGETASLPFVIGPIFMMVLGWFLFKRLLFDLVDEVWDDGEALVVRNKNHEERIPLSQIINVSDSFLTNPPRITLTLREPSFFGKEITFTPPVRFFRFFRNPMATELIERVDAARRR